MLDKKNRLIPIYDAFEAAATDFKKDAACKKGCAFCCSDAGSIHITTLEGLVINELIESLPRPRQVALKKSLKPDMRRREQERPSACPFLMKNGDGETYVCCIHATRPRFCREYKCYTVRILNATGTEVGRVRGRRTLASEDPALLGLWEGSVAPLSGADDAGWRRELKRILGEAEYRVVFYD